MKVDIVDQGADFSECGRYRYMLWRIWDRSKPFVMCIGLNPSKASKTKNDNTISTLINMLSDLGYGGFYMTNLYAYITTIPAELAMIPYPVSEVDFKNKNTEILIKVGATLCSDVIFCWGSFKQAMWRAKQVERLFQGAKCFGKNRDGSPFHPRALIYNGQLKEVKLINYHL